MNNNEYEKSKENLRNAIRQISDYADDIAVILYESLNSNKRYFV